MCAYSFEGWNAHQSLGMLLTKRMENAGLKPLGFVANDYAIAAYSLEPVTDPKALFSPDILEQEFIDWVEQSHLLKRAFREVAALASGVEPMLHAHLLHSVHLVAFAPGRIEIRPNAHAPRDFAGILEV